MASRFVMIPSLVFGGVTNYVAPYQDAISNGVISVAVVLISVYCINKYKPFEKIKEWQHNKKSNHSQLE